MLNPIISNARILFFLISFLLFPAATYAQRNVPSDLNKKNTFVDKRSVTDTSDGCTIWFDGDYEDCCTQHDADYRRNGLNWRTRLRADNRLFICIAGKKGVWHLALAPVMWTGVRIFGSDLVPLSSRNIIHKFSKRMFASFGKRDKRFRRNISRKTNGKDD